jgi:DNA polymerase-3 subunit gamma/tau
VAASDEPSLDDEDAPAHPGATLSGEAAAMELLRVGLGATIIDP